MTPMILCDRGGPRDAYKIKAKTVVRIRLTMLTVAS
jgi:hypothetical protein